MLPGALQIDYLRASGVLNLMTKPEPEEEEDIMECQQCGVVGERNFRETTSGIRCRLCKAWWSKDEPEVTTADIDAEIQKKKLTPPAKEEESEESEEKSQEKSDEEEEDEDTSSTLTGKLDDLIMKKRQGEVEEEDEDDEEEEEDEEDEDDEIEEINNPNYPPDQDSEESESESEDDD